ncbi:MAG: APC family permease [Chloroflexi bacterium]|nr:APC family permease [Chloroflexota bacterium]MCL5274869.1 APC family permease [Chloroflexota bacterium]
MIFSILLLLVVIFLAYKASPKENKEHAHVHGAGQIGLLAALALFGVDYFTSYYYATGEMMSALHPYGLQQYAVIAVAIISLANIVFGALYMYSLGVCNEGGGSYTASMRYLKPTLSLIVAVTLIQDYVLTIVVSALSGGDQLLSVLNAYDANWVWHFAIGAILAAVTWFLTIRGRGESSKVVFTLLGVFAMLTVVMVTGLGGAIINDVKSVPATEVTQAVPLGQAMLHMLTASMKGMVALTGLEAMSNGIQFVIDEDAGIVKWGKKRLPRLQKLWNFYSGKAGIGRFVQTSFLFYGGVTTMILTVFSVHFNVFDGTLGKTLVGNLAAIGFGQIPGGEILFWAYQLLGVALLAAASMTAFQDLQATAWRDVAMGEMPEVVVYRNAQGTFTRSVTAGFILAVVIMFIVRGQTTLAVPFYGVGVFMPIMVMGLAMRQHVKKTYTGRPRRWGMAASSIAAILAGVVFVGQIVGKWSEGGWVVLISFSVLAIAAHGLLLSPQGYREPRQIHRIVREKARVQGAMASIVEWQSLRMQEYRYELFTALTHLFDIFGVRRPARYESVPAPAGEYDAAMHVDHPDAPSILTQFIKNDPAANPLAQKPKDATAAGHAH